MSDKDKGEDSRMRKILTFRCNKKEEMGEGFPYPKETNPLFEK